MTKILHIPTGEYVTYISSVAYDKKHSTADAAVINFEDSFFYELHNDITLTEAVNSFIQLKLVSKLTSTYEYEYEIIYD